jgi:Ferritin-like domain/TAT (twin-arginine translocation) pathway signal sequence
MRNPSHSETQISPEESAINVLARDDVERRKFLKMAGAAGAGAALAALIAACGSSDDNSSTSTTSGGGGSAAASSGRPPANTFGGGDLGIVNYALTLEYLEADFYKEVAASGLFKGSKYLPTLEKFGAEEAAHVSALEATANKLGTAAPKPKTDFSKALKSAKTVVDTAAMVENIGTAAYLGQAANIQSKEVLAAALSIHTVEARHASVLNQIRKSGGFQEGKFLGILPDGAFGVPATAQTVLPLVMPFIVS